MNSNRKTLKPDQLPVLQGYLTKQTGTGLLSSRNSQRRWCCLYKPALFYAFEKEDSLSSVSILDLREVIHVEQAHKKKRDKTQFFINLHTPKKIEIWLANSQEEAERWLREIESLILAMKTQDHSLPCEGHTVSTLTAGSVASHAPTSRDSMLSTSMSFSSSASVSPSDNWIIDPSEINFEEGKILGKGSFGCVQLATWRGTNVAVKTLFGNVGAASEDFFHELAMLGRLHHPNIVQLMGYCSSGNGPMAQQCLVTEYLPGGSLSQFLNDLQSQGKGLDFRLLLNIAMDTCKGMICLHAEKPPIIHRDLKSANILIASVSPEAPVNAKVADFGIATEHSSQSEHTKHQGTFIYMAPEVFSSENYTTKVDVFSFGLILWEMCSLERPWKEYKFQFQIEEAIVKGQRPVIPGFTPADLKGLINECWLNGPNDRPEFTAILKRLKAMPKDPPSWPVGSSIPFSGSEGTVNVGIPVQTATTTIKTVASQATVSTIPVSNGEYADVILHDLFDGKESVSWNEFCTECAKVLHATQVDLLRIKNILSDDGVNVTRRSYTNFLKWFSPLNQEDSIYEENAKAQVEDGVSISDIKALLNTQWFHGLIDASTTITRLSNQSSGTYLIRFSGSEPGNYALSLNDNGKIRHWKIIASKTDRSFTINNKSFTSLNDIVSQTNFEFLETKLGSAPVLKFPCPKTKGEE